MNQNGIDTLLMGHHRGDQIENKLTRGHGMKPLARMDGRDPSGKSKWIVRPLLGVDKVRSLITS
jgi:tRNA(Ile)-lysidine synthase TilS/MesJ